MEAGVAVVAVWRAVEEVMGGMELVGLSDDVVGAGLEAQGSKKVMVVSVAVTDVASDRLGPVLAFWLAVLLEVGAPEALRLLVRLVTVDAMEVRSVPLPVGAAAAGMVALAVPAEGMGTLEGVWIMELLLLGVLEGVEEAWDKQPLEATVRCHRACRRPSFRKALPQATRTLSRIHIRCSMCSARCSLSMARHTISMA